MNYSQKEQILQRNTELFDSNDQLQFAALIHKPFWIS